jgi:hypothetical protein
MSQQSYVTTYSTGNTGISLVPTDAERITTPKGLLVTRALELQEGWVGQIIVDKQIVWQGAAVEDERDATQEATSRVVERLKWLFMNEESAG